MDKNIIKIINEEISNFDYLNQDNTSNENEIINVLSNEDFQKHFICDSLLHNEKIKQINVTDAVISGGWEDPNSDSMGLTYYIDLEYTYDQTKEPIKLTLDFDSEHISINKDEYSQDNGYENEPDYDTWFSYINWNDITVDLFSIDGDTIEFTAFKRAPDEIKTLFIRQYVEEFILKYTNTEIRTNDTKGKISDIARRLSYCF